MYSSYGIAFDRKGELSFCHGFARFVVIFGTDNSSISHTDNHKNKFSVLDEGDTFGINVRLGVQRKSLVLVLVKQRKKFAL